MRRSAAGILGSGVRALTICLVAASLSIAIACGDSGGETSNAGTDTATGATGTTNTATMTETAGTGSTTETSAGPGTGTESSSDTAPNSCPPVESDTIEAELVDCSDPNMETPPSNADMPGDPCCTLKQSCTGVVVDPEEFPPASELGDWLICIDGVWTINQAGCIADCAELSTPNQTICYGGCFWREGFAKPTCGCVEG